MRLVPVLTAVALVCAGAGSWYWLKTSVATKENAPRSDRRRGPPREAAVPVVAVPVTRQTVAVYRDGIGTVQSLATVTVRSQVDGRLMSVDFAEGQTVAKGDVLARIDPTVYRALYEQAVAKKAQDQATLANARMDLQRYQKLAQSNAGPKQQADQQAAIVAQLEAQVQADDAAIANAKAVLDYTVISSPIDGRTGLRLVDPGNIVKAGDASGLVTIAQIKPIAVVFTLPQRDLAIVAAALSRGAAALARGAAQTVPVEVMEQEGRGVLARGTLQTIDNQIDVSTGTIKLKAVFPNDDFKLWPGQFITTRVAVESLADAKVVPTPAVRRGPNGTFVYVVGEDSKVSMRPVKVVLQDEVRAVLGEGVDTGMQVVTVGFAQLADGKQVTISGGDPAVPGAGPGAGPGGAKEGAPATTGSVPDAAAPAPGTERKRGFGKDGGSKEGGGKDGGGRERRHREEATPARPG